MEENYFIQNAEGTGCLDVHTGEWLCPSKDTPTLFSHYERIEYENERLLPNGASWVVA